MPWAPRPRRILGSSCVLLLSAATTLAVAGPAAATDGQVLVSAAAGGFHDDTTTASVTPLTGIGSAGLPCLTAGTSATATPVQGCGLDPVDAPGVLRLTADTANTLSGIAYNTPFPLSHGLTVQFKAYFWGGPGDGISFDLATATPTQLGAGGGALGYSPGGSGSGLPGGYLGIGLDTFGNYATTLADGETCGDNALGTPDFNGAVDVRGPGNASNGYCLLSSSDPALGGIGVAGFSADTTRAAGERGVEVVIDPVAGTYSVGFDPGGGTNYIAATSGSLPEFYYEPADATSETGLPPAVTFVLAGAAGGAPGFHEISDLTAVTGPVLGLSAADSVGGATVPGGTFNYVFTPQIVSGGEADPTSLVLSATLPAGVVAGTPSGPGWNCAASSGANASCTWAGAAIPGGTTLAPVTVPVTVTAGAAGQNLAASASLNSDDAATPVATTDTVAVGAAAPTTIPPGSGPATPHGHAGNNDPNPNTNPITAPEPTVATANQPTVSAVCHGSCSLEATTGDEDVDIHAAQVGAGPTGSAITAQFRMPSPASDPVFFVTIDGGGDIPRCPGYRTRDSDWVQFGFEDSTGGAAFEKTATMTSRHPTARDEAKRALSQHQVCFSAPYRFAPRHGFKLARHGSDYEGVLPDCTVHTVAEPCVVSRSLVRSAAGWAVRLVFRVAPNAHDPKALG
jgi:hypothetical protein